MFHSTFIGRAAQKNKGRISRFLANKCTIASRIDAFAEEPIGRTFGTFLKQQVNTYYSSKQVLSTRLLLQVEDRLKYFEKGDIPKKNLDVMREALAASTEEKVTISLKKNVCCNIKPKY